MADRTIESAEIEQLWRQLHNEDISEKDEARDRIFDIFLPFARMLAAKLYMRRVQMELEFLDFFQFASVGLLEAVERFDPDVGVKFETYSAPRITGAILTGIESLSEKQEQVSTRKRVLSERVQSLQSSRKRKEAKEPDLVFSRLAEVAIGLAVGFALEGSGMFQHEAETPVLEDSTYKSVELAQLRQRIESIVEELPPNERKVIKHHYWQYQSFEEISRILGLTKGRVSQIHKEALRRIHACLDQDRGIDFNF